MRFLSSLLVFVPWSSLLWAAGARFRGGPAAKGAKFIASESGPSELQQRGYPSSSHQTREHDLWQAARACYRRRLLQATPVADAPSLG